MSKYDHNNWLYESSIILFLIIEIIILRCAIQKIREALTANENQVTLEPAKRFVVGGLIAFVMLGRSNLKCHLLSYIYFV